MLSGPIMPKASACWKGTNVATSSVKALTLGWCRTHLAGLERKRSRSLLLMEDDVETSVN